MPEGVGSALGGVEQDAAAVTGGEAGDSGVAARWLWSQADSDLLSVGQGGSGLRDVPWDGKAEDRELQNQALVPGTAAPPVRFRRGAPRTPVL